MALIGPAATPTIAISRALKRAGLVQGKGKDFQVKGRYRNGERLFTYVRVYGNQAEAVITERADDIERWAAESGFPFRVSVLYMSRYPITDVHNGPRPRVRQEPPAVEAAPAPAAEEPTTPASLTVKMTANREALDRIRAKADADRAAHRAEFDARRAAETARHTPAPASAEEPAPAVNLDQAPECPAGLYVVNLPPHPPARLVRRGVRPVRPRRPPRPPRRVGQPRGRRPRRPLPLRVGAPLRGRDPDTGRAGGAGALVPLLRTAPRPVVGVPRGGPGVHGRRMGPGHLPGPRGRQQARGPPPHLRPVGRRPRGRIRLELRRPSVRHHGHRPPPPPPLLPGPPPGPQPGGRPGREAGPPDRP